MLIKIRFNPSPCVENDVSAGTHLRAVRRGTARRAPTCERFGQPTAGSIPTIVRAFKSACTKRINELRDAPGAKLWQRNYYEHVIRDEDDLNRIRQYIMDNPAHWAEDENNPALSA